MNRADFPPFTRGFRRAFTPFTSYSGIRYRVIHVIEEDKSYACTHMDGNRVSSAGSNMYMFRSGNCQYSGICFI